MDPVRQWHECVDTKDFSALETLLADDAIFLSPAVHTPKVGKAEVARYLRAAMSILNNDSFRYTAEWREMRTAVLEFEGELDGIYFNGVDLIAWNGDGLITQFKVMIRPLKALNHIVPIMGRALETV